MSDFAKSSLLLDGKVCLITGASGGIGTATAHAFAREGARLILTDIAEESGRALAEMLRQGGVEVEFTPADIRRPEECEAVVARAVARFGRLDVAFNNAGHIGVFGPLHDFDPDELKRTIDINMHGTWNCMAAELRAMLQTGGGVICNNSSVAGIVGGQGSPPYFMTKHAVIGLTRAAAIDYATQNIRVNAIAPGAIDTDMPQRLTGGDPALLATFTQVTPLNRFGRPEEVADTVAFICSERASYITGAIIAADGGWTAQ